MTIYLDEEWLGIEDDIVYPNVQSCVALAVASANGNLGGMHMTIATKAAVMERAGTIIRASLGGPIASVVCIGNLQTFKGGNRDQGMIYKHGLAKTLHKVLDWTGTIYGYDTTPLYTAGRGGNYDGVAVQFWRPNGGGQVQYAVGPKTAWARNGTAVVNTPIYVSLDRTMPSVSNEDFTRIRIVNKAGTACPAYAIQQNQMVGVTLGQCRTF
jgi:hypothetical protein